MSATPSSTPLNPLAPEFSPAVPKTTPCQYNPPYDFHRPLTYCCNPFPFFLHTHHFSGSTNKPPEPAVVSGALAGRPTGFRILPPRLKKLGHCEDDNIEIRLTGKTSLMIKNIPNSFGRKDLMKILDSHCRQTNIQARRVSDGIRSSYDFLYLPMDFVKRANLGYAFVNFTNSVAAVRFCRAFDNFHWTVPGNKKICEITLAKYQGKEELTSHFMNSRFMCHSDEYLPVVLSPASDGFVKYSLRVLGVRVGRNRPPPQPVRNRNRKYPNL